MKENKKVNIKFYLLSCRFSYLKHKLCACSAVAVLFSFLFNYSSYCSLVFIYLFAKQAVFEYINRTVYIDVL